MIIPMVLLTIPAKLLADWLFICIYDWQIRECNYEFLEARDTLPSLERAVVEHYQVILSAALHKGCQGLCEIAPAVLCITILAAVEAGLKATWVRL